MPTMSAAPSARTLAIATPQGEVTVAADDVLRFTAPLLGFPDLGRYVLHQAKPGPLWWLQAVERKDVTFCVVQPAALGLDPDYELDAEEVVDLGTTDPTELQVWTVVVLAPDPRESRTNLRAPILVCRRTGRAKQVVLNDGRLPVRQPLLPPAQPPGKGPG